MAVNGMLVIDALNEANDNSPQSRARNRDADVIGSADWPFQAAVVPPEYVLDAERYHQKFPIDGLISALFMESQVDIACFHGLGMFGIFEDYSPLSVGLEMRRRWPHRVLVKGAVSPFYGLDAALEQLERQVTEHRVDGINIHPWDAIDGRSRTFSFADEELAYPILQRCVDLGVKVVSVHKTIPLGLGPMAAYRLDDIDVAARDFPQLTFEVIAAGQVFLDEAVMQLARFPNVWMNLEVTVHLAMYRPRKFAEIIGEFLLAGGEDRLLFATGCSFVHPQPVIDAFVNFTMPADMLQWGYPELTDAIKEKILGLNFARLHGLDLAARRAAIAQDAIEREKVANGLKAPWVGTTRPSA